MRSSVNILIALCLLAFSLPAKAQFYFDFSSYNEGGIVTYYDDPGIVTAYGGSYTAVAGSLTIHGGITLQVDGPYTASGNSVDSFAGDGFTTWPPKPAAKYIAGAIAPTFDIVKFANGAGQLMNVTNNYGINIAQRLDFANGITTTVRSNTAAGALKFLDNATYTNTAAGDAQHVNGYVSKRGDDAFTFPVGSGTDRRALSITVPANASAQTSVAWIAGNPDTTADPSDGGAGIHPVTSRGEGIVSVSAVGQWDWITTVAATNALTITVSIPEVGAFGVRTDLRLVGWNGTKWVDLSGRVTANGTAENSTLTGTLPAGTNTITAIGIGSISISVALPVTLLRFTAEKKGSSGLLSWETASEQSSDHFEVERSGDGRRFTAIGRVAAADSSATEQRYQFTDADPLMGTNYYRLKIVDIQGGYTYSHIATLNFAALTQVNIYPNPVTDRLNVLVADWSAIKEMRIIDLNGRLIYSAKNAMHGINMRHLASGAYILQIIQTNGSLLNYKVVKK